MSSTPSPASADSASPAQVPAAISRWIKTECGRAKYLQLACRPGLAARLRLAWFVLIAALRDLPQDG
jgi:hypothetical protein